MVLCSALLAGALAEAGLWCAEGPLSASAAFPQGCLRQPASAPVALKIPHEWAVHALSCPFLLCVFGNADLELRRYNTRENIGLVLPCLLPAPLRR